MKLINYIDDWKERNVILCVAVVLSCLVLVKWLLLGPGFFDRHFFFIDFQWRWQECAYVLQGVNPFDVIHGVVPVDHSIGIPGKDAGTVPWAYSLGNVLVFGFLPYQYAVWTCLVVFVSIISITACCLYRYVFYWVNGKGNSGYHYALLAVAFLLLPHYWLTAFLFGNYGAICACLLIIMVTQIEKHPCLSGILLGLASLKPQLAFLFYISLLMKGEWKTLIVASCVVLCSWGATSLLTGIQPLTLLNQMWSQAVGFQEGNTIGYSYYGLLTVLADYKILSVDQSIMISSILGILIVLGGSKYLLTKRWAKNDLFLYFSLPAVVSVFWNYQQSYDRIILVFLVISLLLGVAGSKLDVSRKLALILAPAFLVYFQIGSLMKLTARKLETFRKWLDAPFAEPLFIFLNYYFFITFCILWFAGALLLARKNYELADGK